MYKRAQQGIGYLAQEASVLKTQEQHFKCIAINKFY
jgi:ABC-type lipopolysaccharide export system ATPase subunit